MLDVLLGSETSAAEKRKILENEYHIQMTQKLESEVSGMCNLSKGVLEKGLERGRELGRTEGVELGLAKGMVKSRIADLRNLMETMNLSMEQAMAALKVPEAERQKYRELLSQQ